MKKLYLLGACLILLMACSTDAGLIIDENPDGEVTLKACFELNAQTLNVGETLQVSNCSEGANSYFYEFSNGETSDAENPTISFGEGGTYSITLTVTNEAQETKTQTKSVTVVVIEASYLFPEIPQGFTGLPIETGINLATGNIYSLEIYQDNIGPGGSKFYYREFDADFQYASNYVADKPYNTGSAFVNYYPDGKMNFVFSRTLGSLYATQEVNYNSVWTFLNSSSPATKHSYGYLKDDTNYLYFGAQQDAGLYKGAIEKRNSSGDAFEVTLHSFGAADTMIGDLISTSNGYVAFGAVFTKNITTPYLTAYKPLLLFLDPDLNVLDHIIYEETALTAKVNSCNDLNGSFHLEELSNGNLVMYANGELRITNAEGSPIHTSYFEGSSNIQALVSLGDSFVISTNEYLKKFSATGAPLAHLKYNGNYLPELLKKDNVLYFIAGYDVENEIKIFYGACDNDLNLIDLSP